MDANKTMIVLVAIVAVVAVIVMIGHKDTSSGNDLTGNVVKRSTTMVGLASGIQARQRSPFPAFIATATGERNYLLEKQTNAKNPNYKASVKDASASGYTVLDGIRVNEAYKNARGDTTVSLNSVESTYKKGMFGLGTDFLIYRYRAETVVLFVMQQ